MAEHLGADTFVHVHAGELGTLNVRASGEVPVGHGDTAPTSPPIRAKLHRFDASGLAMH